MATYPPKPPGGGGNPDIGMQRVRPVPSLFPGQPAARIHEKIESHDTSNSNEPVAIMRWHVENVLNADDVEILMEPIAPFYYELEGQTLYWFQKQKRCLAMDRDTGRSLWEYVVTYRPWRNESGTRSFDSTGGQAHIDVSLETLQSTGIGDPPTPTNYGQLITVTKDDVKGVDVVVPALRFSERYDYPKADTLKHSFIKVIHDLTGTVNKEVFRCWPIGDVLFLGATTSEYWDAFTGVRMVAVEYNFEMQRGEEPPFQVGPDPAAGGMQPFDERKNGWDYLWLKYQPQEDLTSMRPTRKIIEAYIERVYEYEDFAKLGLPSDVDLGLDCEFVIEV